MKILITGSSGMLGRALCAELSDGYDIIGLDMVKLRSNQSAKLKRFIRCDITDREKTIAGIAALKPDIVIHTAAYTDVDGCQLNPDKAERVNVQGTEIIALAALQSCAFLFYISTDFVFDGEKKSAYVESDRPNPINVYGRTKLAGERYIQSKLEKFVIVRTSWLFGEGGKNFVGTIIKKREDANELKVVDDQFGSPTYAVDLARAIKVLLSANPCGIYHITNSGTCSRYEFAQAIKEITNLKINILPISSVHYQSPTKRPKMSILKNKRYYESTGEKLRPWKEALTEYLTNEPTKSKG